MSNEDETGHRKPPVHSQFKKGQSGNLKGRPIGTKNLKTDLNEELQEVILVHEGQQPMRISKQRAIVKTLFARALKGDARSTTTLINLMYRALDLQGETVPADEPLDADDVEILEAFRDRLLASANARQPEPRRPSVENPRVPVRQTATTANDEENSE